MKKKLSLIILAFFMLQVSFAQDKSLFTKEQFIKEGDTLNYRMLLPENFDPKKEYPVLFFLHGAGERGNDNEAQLMHGSKLFLKPELRKDFPAIVIFPQCPKNDFWANVKPGDAKTNERYSFQKGENPEKR